MSQETPEILVTSDSSLSVASSHFLPTKAAVETSASDMIELDTAQLKQSAEAIEDFRSPASRRLLQADGLAEHCYPTGQCNLMDLMEGMSGFTLSGEAAIDQLGYRLKKVGDINGDGVDDLVIGAFGADVAGRTDAGKSYVIFGNRTASAWGNGVLNISSLMNGQRGFVLQGEALGDSSGVSVSGAGDINGDGIDDLVVGAFLADPAGRTDAGKTYVVFGNRTAGAWGNGILELSALRNGIRGFVLQGEAAGDSSGYSVSRAGDINGDDIADLVVGAVFADPAGQTNAGKSYVILGNRTASAWGNGILNVSSLMNGQRGFVLQGEALGDQSSISVSQAGDINGDGVDDLVVGAYLADPAGRTDAGKSYVVFGNRTASAWGNGILDLSSLMNGQRGFVLQGEAAGDQSGQSVQMAEDVNGDGINDLVLGAPVADPAGRGAAGKSYVIFGNRTANAWGNGVLELSSLTDGVRGFVLQGEFSIDFVGLSVSGGGDINQDGLADILIGAIRNDIISGFRRSNTYVVYGTDRNLAWGNGILDLSALTDGKRGLFIQGASSNISNWLDINAVIVSDAGDINGDSIDDFIRCCRYESPLNRFQAGSCYVVFGENLTPILVNNNLAIHAGESRVISDLNLGATDDQPFNHRLIYNITNVTRGQFEAISAFGVPITQFKQANITAGQVRFVHDGSQIAPSYKISVSDGIKSSVPVLANLTFYRQPSLTSSYALLEGATQILSSGHIQIIDDYPNNQVVLQVENMTHGQFILTPPGAQNITEFTRAQLLAGQVSFQHDGSEFAPSYAVSLQDPYLSLPPVLSNITFIQVNDPPVLVRNRLNISQGQTVTLDSNSLFAADPDNTDDQLTFYVSNIQRGVFYVTSQLNPIYEFLQSNISSGAIHFVHDGSGFPPYYQVIVSDGQASSPLQTVSVTFNGVNRAPQLLNAILSVTEGQTVVVTPTLFSISDIDTPPEQLIFLVSNVSHGQFERSSFPGLEITSFTMQEVQQNTIRFVHDSSELPPSLEVAVTDGVTATTPRAAVISYTPVNNPPVLVNNSLTISEGGTVVFTVSDLAATDRDSTESGLVFTTSQVQQGYFELYSNQTVTSFTQQQVASGAVSFVHNGGEVAPSYQVSVNDGSLSTFPQSAVVTYIPVNDPPHIVINQLSIVEGGSSVLTTSQLSIEDPDNSASQLTITPSAVQGGQFEQVFNPGIALTSFRQQDIQTGFIRFVDDGSETVPTYALTVSDGALTDGPSTATIQYTPINDAPIITQNQLTVKEGETVALSSSDLSATDPDDPSSSLVFTVSQVAHGQFVQAGSATPLISFSQQQVIDGAIEFTHDGTQEAASYLVSISDGRLATAPQLAAVSFIAENDSPVMINNLLTIEQGRSVLITSNELRATDEETPADDLLFSISDLEHGRFEYVADPGRSITTFSQDKIKTADIRFVSDGSITAPSYQVQVSDGELSSNKTQTVVNFELAPPDESGASSEFTTRDLISLLSALGSVALTVGGYLYWRSKTAEHRRGHDFANHLRKIMNLEYYDFTKGQGEIYKTKINNFITYINLHHDNFYAKLAPEEKKSFAMCVAFMLSERNLLKRSGTSAGVFNWWLCFTSGWSSALDLNEFEKQSPEIANQAITSWRSQAKPTERWSYIPRGYSDKWRYFCATDNCCPSNTPKTTAAMAKEILPETKGGIVSDVEIEMLPTASGSRATSTQTTTLSPPPPRPTSGSASGFFGSGEKQRLQQLENQMLTHSQELTAIHEKLDGVLLHLGQPKK